jgi:hypothetical protein
MHPMPLNQRDWNAIDPEYRHIIDGAPHVIAYGEQLRDLVLVLVALPPRPSGQLSQLRTA